PETCGQCRSVVPCAGALVRSGLRHDGDRGNDRDPFRPADDPGLTCRCGEQTLVDGSDRFAHALQQTRVCRVRAVRPGVVDPGAALAIDPATIGRSCCLCDPVSDIPG